MHQSKSVQHKATVPVLSDKVRVVRCVSPVDSHDPPIPRTYLPLPAPIFPWRFLHACERDGEDLGPVTLCYVTCYVTYYVRNVRNGNAVITLTPRYVVRLRALRVFCYVTCM